MKYLFLIICLILYSCVREERLDGGCVPTEMFPFDRFSFNSQEKTDSAFVYGYNWWFMEPRYQSEKCKLIGSAKLECPWVSAEKKDDTTVVVSVKQNNTGKKRDISININVNDGSGEKCSENRKWLTITQCFEITDMELSKEEFLFRAEGGVDSVIVTTNRESWLRHPFIGVRYGDIYYEYQKGFDFSDYSDIKDPWFAITDIIDGRKIIFSVSKNESGKERNSILRLDPYNCGANFKIIQSAE